MSLIQLINDIEQLIGLFSKKYKTVSADHHHGLTQDIAFELKPAQQFLSQLGGEADHKSMLSVRKSKTPTQDNLNIKSFFPKDNAPALKIAAQCIDKLFDSAKIYINTSLFPAGLYATAMQHKWIKAHDVSLSNDAKIHWQNLAVGVCHAQLIYSLVDCVINKNGKSISTPKTGEIKDNDPGILLLSSPRLQFKNGVADRLTKEQQQKYIEAMYRNLFQATLAEGRQYLAMPAAGLGSSGGSHEAYFSALMTVAKEFPELNIIYHPSNHVKEFDKALIKAKLNNVVKASKDIIIIANQLSQQGKLCALHNPSYTDVIYGLCDVGAFWKKGKNKQFIFEEYIGSMTTAPMNSSGFNPQAYQNIVERQLKATMQTLPTIPQPDELPSKLPDPIVEPDIQITPSEPPIIIHTIPTTSPVEIVLNIPVVTEPCPTVEQPPIPKPSPISTNPNGIFTPEPQKRVQSSLNEDETKEINRIIHGLQREIDSYWPYPNKDVKQIKIDALLSLKIKAQSQALNDAIRDIKSEFPRVVEGYISTRTSHLLHALEHKTSTQLRRG